MTTAALPSAARGGASAAWGGRRAALLLLLRLVVGIGLAPAPCAGFLSFSPIFARGHRYFDQYREAEGPTAAVAPPQPPLLLLALRALQEHLEGDLVSLGPPLLQELRLCAVRGDGGAVALCLRDDDVPTDLYADPRVQPLEPAAVADGDVVKAYGEGVFSQRPIPSLGGGPGIDTSPQSSSFCWGGGQRGRKKMGG